MSDGLYQQLNYSLYLVTSSAFIGTVEDLERSVTLQQILFIYWIRMTQHDTATSRTFLKVTPQPNQITERISKRRRVFPARGQSWNKQSYLETSREDIREAHTILASWFTVITCILFNRLVITRLEVVYRRLFQFWLIFPNQNYLLNE